MSIRAPHVVDASGFMWELRKWSGGPSQTNQPLVVLRRVFPGHMSSSRSRVTFWAAWAAAFMSREAIAADIVKVDSRHRTPPRF